MTKSEAIQVLKLNEQECDDDSILEAIELELFELKNYFVRNTPIVALFKKRFYTLGQIATAAKMLGVDYKLITCSVLEEFSSSDFLQFMRWYEQQQAQIKGKLYASYNPYEIECLAKNLLQLELIYVEQCIEFGTKNNYEAFIEETPKMADKLDSGQLILQLTKIKKQPTELVAEYARCLAYSKLNNEF